MKLCVFDLDGTLLDTLPSIAYFGNGALVKNGLSPIPAEEYRFFAGDGIYTLVHRMLAWLGADTEDMFARVFEDYKTAYHADTTRGTQMFAGLSDVLDRLHADGIQLAVFSNKPDEAVQDLWQTLLGKDRFAAAVGQIDGVPLKPDPTAVFRMMEQVGATAEQTCYIGDTSTDMQTAVNAGVYAVGVLWGFRGAEELQGAGADVLCATPEELYRIIREKLFAAEM